MDIAEETKKGRNYSYYFTTTNDFQTLTL